MAGASSVLPAAPTVITSTGAIRGRTQQGVQQRRGGGSSSHGPDTRLWTTASDRSSGLEPRSQTEDFGLGDLVDLSDDKEQLPRSTTNGRRGGNQLGGSQPAVELVSFVQIANQQEQQLCPAGTAAAATISARQPQHPLDFLLGGEPDDAVSTTGGAGVSGAVSAEATFPNFTSFSNLFRGFTSATSAGTRGIAAPADAAPAASSGEPAWGSFSAAAGSGAASHGFQRPSSTWARSRYCHSQSTNDIHDLLMQQRAMREAPSTGEGPGGSSSRWDGPSMPASARAVSGMFYKPPSVMQTNRIGLDNNVDPLADFLHRAAPANAVTAAAATRPAAVAAPLPVSPPGRGTSSSAKGASGSASSAGGGGAVKAETSFVTDTRGVNMSQRELLLYAIPLFKDKMVFLPVVNWKVAEDTSTVLGRVSAGMSNVQQNISNMWHSLKDKGSLPAKIYKAGQAIFENLNAEERLMKNIPRKANKLVVHHPATVAPDEIQDLLTQLTASFCYKSVGKAAVAGVMLPVAVGLEVLAVPGIGWYTAYQLFKSTSAAAGGSRLNNYLKSDKSEVRICYAPCTKMDMYILKSRISPDGVLGSEDIEDLCHDISQPSLLHPLMELRNRHLRKTQMTKASYALLPMSTPDQDEQYGNNGPKKMD